MLLGDIIKKYRVEHQMSLQDFANLINSSRSYIHMLEKNVNPSTNKPINPSIETLKLLANAMNMDLEFLLKQLDDDQDIYLDEKEYKKQFKSKDENESRYTSYDGVDIEGLDEKDVEELNRFVEFLKQKKKEK